MAEESVVARARAQIDASVRRTLREEARRNELHLAYGRSVWGLSAALAWVFDFVIAPGQLPNAWIEDSLQTSFFLANLLFVIWLRRGHYWKGLSFLVPVVDALTVLGLAYLQISLYGPDLYVQWGLRTSLVLVCAILAVSGCVRLDPRVLYLTTFLSIVVYELVAVKVGWIQVDAFVVAGLLGLGYFGVRLTRVVRRAAQDEVGRGTLRRFLPESVIESAHRDPLGLLTEPRAVDLTVVVTDLRDFTSFSERADPRVVFDVLNEVHGAMGDIVSQHSGMVDKFTGDGMLAVFGLAGATDHAAAALRAVADMRRALERLQTTVVAGAALDLRLGIGVHSGTVHVGCIGSDTRLEFTVIGDVVNTAFRLQALSKELRVDVLVSEDTMRAARNESFSFKPLGRFTIRGRRDELDLFALIDFPSPPR